MAKSYYAVLLSLVFIAALFQNCSKAKDEAFVYSAASTSENYFQKSEVIVVEVYYEPDAEPFIGNNNTGTQLWSILEKNLQAIFQYRSDLPAIVVPKQLNEMTVLPAQHRSQWTSMDILALNGKHRTVLPSVQESRFYVYFVNGNFSNDGVVDPNVIGVNITGTPVIAIFKDVVKSTGGTWTTKYVEQSTLVHEMGHALGFVNNGIPLTSQYQDEEHGNHSKNSNCVMYYANEGASDMAAFVANYINQHDVVMWGPEVLSDAENFSH